MPPKNLRNKLVQRWEAPPPPVVPQATTEALGDALSLRVPRTPQEPVDLSLQEQGKMARLRDPSFSSPLSVERPLGIAINGMENVGGAVVGTAALAKELADTSVDLNQAVSGDVEAAERVVDRAREFYLGSVEGLTQLASEVFSHPLKWIQQNPDVALEFLAAGKAARGVRSVNNATTGGGPPNAMARDPLSAPVYPTPKIDPKDHSKKAWEQYAKVLDRQHDVDTRAPLINASAMPRGVTPVLHNSAVTDRHSLGYYDDSSKTVHLATYQSIPELNLTAEHEIQHARTQPEYFDETRVSIQRLQAIVFDYALEAARTAEQLYKEAKPVETKDLFRRGIKGLREGGGVDVLEESKKAGASIFAEIMGVSPRVAREALDYYHQITYSLTDPKRAYGYTNAAGQGSTLDRATEEGITHIMGASKYARNRQGHGRVKSDTKPPTKGVPGFLDEDIQDMGTSVNDAKAALLRSYFLPKAPPSSMAASLIEGVTNLRNSYTVATTKRDIPDGMRAFAYRDVQDQATNIARIFSEMANNRDVFSSVQRELLDVRNKVPMRILDRLDSYLVEMHELDRMFNRAVELLRAPENADPYFLDLNSTFMQDMRSEFRNNLARNNPQLLQALERPHISRVPTPRTYDSERNALVIKHTK